MDSLVPYVELHCHSAFSFLDGASTPAELACAAAELGYRALALTDHNGTWGSMEFAHACEDLGIQVITGAEVTVEQAAHLTLLVENRTGYQNLCRLLTEAHSHTRDSTQRTAAQPWVSFEQVEAHAEGLVCLSGCARDGVVAGRWERGDPPVGTALARRLLASFGSDNFRIELQRPYWRHDRERNRWLRSLAERLGVPCVATGNVHSHTRSRASLQDTFVAVRLGITLDESESRRRGNTTSTLASPEAMALRFAEHPEAVTETLRIAERLDFNLTSELGYRYPGVEDLDADRKLTALCQRLLGDRYRDAVDLPVAKRRLDAELGVIRKLDLSGFFLLHHDLLELAREVAAEVRGPDSARSVLPPGRGRGSSVSSIVCYLTGLSHIDPVKADLFTGRFLNDEVTAAPDIDLDFPRDIREKLIPRVHERYGAEHSALVAAFPTYRPRSAVRDFGKALGLPPGEIERVARMVGFHEKDAEIQRDVVVAIGDRRAASPRWRKLVFLCGEALGLPRHASQHPGGMVISTRPLVEICPVVPAAIEGRQIVQWDKDSCADAGFLKIDLLGLGMLSAVERCIEEIGRVRNQRIDLSRIPLDDPETFDSIQAAETTGVFQIESRAQMQMLPRTLPRDLDDLTVQVALVRPGPIQGGAIHPYIERRKLLREDPEYEIPYEHHLLEPVLRDTLGTIVFQEQVIEVAMALSGFSSSEAEGLRRAMSRKRSEEAIRSHHERFISGALKRKVPPEVAERVWAQIEGFSGFGFPKAHSAAFGLLAYQSAWLRIHYGPEFLSSLLNEQPMGFYPPDSLVHESQRRGVRVLPPEVNHSRVLCHVERDRGGLSVRIGLGYVKEVHEQEVTALVKERGRSGPYQSIGDLASRSGVSRDGLERLAWAGALDSLTLSAAPKRREAFWHSGVLKTGRRLKSGTQLSLSLDSPQTPELEPLGSWEAVIADYRSVGMTLGQHPMTLLRDELGPDVIISSGLRGIADDTTVTVAGMVVARQRPETAKGITFMLLEDEDGTINLIVPAKVFGKFRGVVRTAPIVQARGRLERRDGAINVIVTEIGALGHTASKSDVRHIGFSPKQQNSHPDAFHDAKPADLAELRRAREQVVAELRAVAPAGHSFGRRGR